MMLGSMISLGFRLLTTAMGGVNCRNACFGRRPLLAGNGERSPPPPPPPMAFCFAAASGGGARSIGEIRGTYCLTLSCTALEDNTVNSSTANTTWPPVDIAVQDKKSVEELNSAGHGPL